MRDRRLLAALIVAGLAVAVAVTAYAITDRGHMGRFAIKP